MREFLCEGIIDSFNDGHLSVTKSDFIQTPVTGVSLRRNDELDLIFEFTSRGSIKEKPERYPAGTVRSSAIVRLPNVIKANMDRKKGRTTWIAQPKRVGFLAACFSFSQLARRDE
jgi:hypothetical protein